MPRSIRNSKKCSAAPIMRWLKEHVYICFTKLGFWEITKLLAPALISLWTTEFDVPSEGAWTSTIWPCVFPHFINISALVIRKSRLLFSLSFSFSLRLPDYYCLHYVVTCCFLNASASAFSPPNFKNVIHPAYSLQGCSSFSNPFIYHSCSRQPYYHLCRVTCHSASLSQKKKKGCCFYRGVQAAWLCRKAQFVIALGSRMCVSCAPESHFLSLLTKATNSDSPKPTFPCF